MDDKSDIEKLLEVAHRIERGDIATVKVLGRVFKIRDIKRNILNRIYDIQFRVKFYSGKDGLGYMRKRMRFINSADARIASLILLNEWANIPLLHAIHWRILNRRYTTETFSVIIEAALNNRETGFFLKNSVHYQNMLATRVMMIKT